MLEGDKVDYRTSGSKASTLDVPPDLTQLTRDSRYQNSGGSVSATTYQSPTTAPATQAAAVAPAAMGDVRMERSGHQRWLVTTMPPEQLWTKLREFWQENNFALTLDSPQTGVMETDWAENRAKLPQDIIRRTIGKVFDSIYSTGEMDRFRTRVERTPQGNEVYVSHRGMVEVYTTSQKDDTKWQPRPPDEDLEATMLSRLMVKLGTKPEEVKTLVTAPSAPARARVVNESGVPAVQIDEGFDRAWRRVGLALDRSGFTVEDRDRAQGLYFVRFVTPTVGETKEPGFFSKMFGGKSDTPAPERYRVAVKGSGESTLVSVLNSQGSPEGGATAQRIVSLLAEDLK